MTNDILMEYKNWVMGIVMDKEHQFYYELLDKLFHTEFTWFVKGDENRAADGVHLRTIFCDLNKLEGDIFDEPCNVLEMMVALSVRCSEDILWDGENNWTPYLFWTMIDNLGLLDMVDGVFDEAYVNERIGIFLSRNYGENGDGSLFILSHFPKNFKRLEIWYQCQNWISENFV